MAENNTKPRLLIVDDEAEVRSVLSDLLGDIYQCSQAPSAEEALAQLRERDYHLVISDITMSGMSGLEMIPHVKVISPDTVIVMISGMQTIESAINALRLGAFDYLMKTGWGCASLTGTVKRSFVASSFSKAPLASSRNTMKSGMDRVTRWV